MPLIDDLVDGVFSQVDIDQVIDRQAVWDKCISALKELEKGHFFCEDWDGAVRRGALRATLERLRERMQEAEAIMNR